MALVHGFVLPCLTNVMRRELVQQGLDSKQDGALEQHRVEMNDHAWQQDPQCASWASGEECDGGQQYVDGKTDAVGSTTSASREYPER